MYDDHMHRISKQSQQRKNRPVSLDYERVQGNNQTIRLSPDSPHRQNPPAFGNLRLDAALRTTYNSNRQQFNKSVDVGKMNNKTIETRLLSIYNSKKGSPHSIILRRNNK